ncbi:hypothetical protein QAD02_021715 [Eretmocerus hayati]|uniref:Uncharacterized protein n=1 Tax=Eretmocerus hayati TaxID=131215 RepID=A0ACC2PR96_9HYME|nr:hypothetical protein QAD02_021715 [Eretmocerus hayati]
MLVDAGVPVSTMKDTCLNFDQSKPELLKKDDRPRCSVITDTHTMLGKCNLELYRIKHKSNVCCNDFPLPEDGIIERDWLQEYHDRINSAGETVSVLAHNKVRTTLKSNEKPRVIQLSCASIQEIENMRNGEYILDGGGIAPGIYSFQEGEGEICYINDTARDL